MIVHSMLLAQNLPLNTRFLLLPQSGAGILVLSKSHVPARRSLNKSTHVPLVAQTHMTVFTYMLCCCKVAPEST